MREIEVTDEQYEYLESLREEIKAEVVGPYGHVRTVDAVQYLIDNHEGDVDVEVAAAGELAVAGDADGRDSSADTEPAGGTAADDTDPSDGSPATPDDSDDPEANEGLKVVDGIGPSRAATLRSAGYDTLAAVASAAPDALAAELDGVTGEQAAELVANAETHTEDTTAETDEETTEHNASNSESTDTNSSSGLPSGSGPSPTDSSDDSGMLSAMQQLLDEYDDKWQQASGTGYEVDLPDGSTESANTKDDVRALLFRHYN